MKTLLSLLPVLLLFAACSKAPRDIEYGRDMCAWCKMTVVDNQHAARAVTDKGKVYTFDAIECLVPFVNAMEDTPFRTLEINAFNQPGHLLPAEASTYLISPAMPSPMGAYLSAYATRDDALRMQAEKGGELYNWASLQRHLDH